MKKNSQQKNKKASKGAVKKQNIEEAVDDSNQSVEENEETKEESCEAPKEENSDTAEVETEESSEISTKLDSSATETSLQTENNSKRRFQQENDNRYKKRKLDKSNAFKLTVSFPSGGPTYNYKDVLQEVLKHFSNVNNPGILSTKFDNMEVLNNSYDNLRQLRLENRSLWLKRKYLPDVGSANPLKKLAYLPRSDNTLLEKMKEYYEADLIEPLGKKENVKLHILTFSSEESANAAVAKDGFEFSGYVVTLRQFFEYERKNVNVGQEKSETEVKKSAKETDKKEEKKEEEECDDEEEEEDDQENAEEESGDEDEKENGDAEEEDDDEDDKEDDDEDDKEDDDKEDDDDDEDEKMEDE